MTAIGSLSSKIDFQQNLGTMAHTASKPPSALMVGTGEYTTGYVHGKQSGSDKKIGVIALCLFDLRSSHRGNKVDKIKMVGTSGVTFPGIRKHFELNIASAYKDMDVQFESFPNDDVKSDPKAYIAAMDSMNKGDFVTIYTPDDTHFEIAQAAIQRGLHVLVTKPPVKTLKEHKELVELARKHNVLVCVEYHKRFDPCYADAREKIRTWGDFGYFNSYMSQPKFQLDTFKSWAGVSSDISYYLNSHHIDIHCWSMQGIAKPIRVVAMASNGVATSEPFNLASQTEDTITIMTQWINIKTGNTGTAVYTASWAAPKADVHSQQRFFCMSHKGEVSIDQAHRGYYVATDNGGYASINPLYMKYTPNSKGQFAGQNGYGYRSISEFVEAVQKINSGLASPADFDGELPTLKTTSTTTAILEAGYLSLHQKKAVIIEYNDNSEEPISIRTE